VEPQTRQQKFRLHAMLAQGLRIDGCDSATWAPAARRRCSSARCLPAFEHPTALRQHPVVKRSTHLQPAVLRLRRVVSREHLRAGGEISGQSQLHLQATQATQATE
jgi:hypothetical protein